MSGRRIVLLDFDHTLVDDNSDTFVPLRLEPSLQAHFRAEHARGVPWTALMDDVLGRLHAAGHGEAALAAALCALPAHAGMQAAVRAAAAAGAHVAVVSDANSFFIPAWLAHAGLAPLVAAVHTNPAAFEASGRLRVQPYHARDVQPHGCARCPPNMCKGLIVDAIVLRGGGGGADGGARVFYAGDGSGDVCPALRLRAGDVAAARADCAMARQLLAEGDRLHARLVVWRDGDDVLRELQAWLDE